MTVYLRSLSLSMLFAAGLFMDVPAAYADSLKDSLSELVKAHKRILAAQADTSAAREQVRITLGDWFPTLDVTGSWGYEKQNKPPGSDDTDLTPRKLDVKLTQQLWDFGSSNAGIRRARLTHEQAVKTEDATRQSLLLEGITAHLNLMRANKLLQFAKGSEANIKRQAELEDARVQRGAGFSTDVLQAKTQLAGANARRIQAGGALQTALNRYRALFYKDPGDIAKMTEPRIPLELLPKSLNELTSLVIQGNPQLAASRISADIAREDINKTQADEFFPDLNAIAQEVRKVDEGGTSGSKMERIVKVELSYNLNLGLTAINTLRASELSHTASVSRFGDTRDLVEEAALNAWYSLQTARDNAEQLHNQADIAAEFLELARKERQLGNRSLLDVLAGETALINASSDATSADTDVTIVAFTLLSVMGKLSPNVVE